MDFHDEKKFTFWHLTVIKYFIFSIQIYHIMHNAAKQSLHWPPRFSLTIKI